MSSPDHGDDDELIPIMAFGHSFSLLPELAQDLITLEKEGAIYAEFWDEDSQQFPYYRIAFLPAEIVRYVEGHVAMQEFEDASRLVLRLKRHLEKYPIRRLHRRSTPTVTSAKAS